MKRHLATRDLYDKTASGILVPSGSTTDTRSFARTSVAATKLDGLEMLKVFRSNGLDPTRSASLMALVDQTSALSDALLTAQDNQTSYAQLFAALQLRRLIEAVEVIANDPSLPRLLSELLDGTLDLLARTRSKAKDTLWELELLRTLRSNGVSTEIGEPDLLLAASADQVGVACKKLYSAANFSKVLSGAVDQIRRSLKLGLVAVNIDDLVPANSILKAPTEDVAANMLNTRVSEFMVEQERYLRRYIEPGRAIAVLVSCAALTDLAQNEPRFCNFRQTIAWHIPSVSPQIDGQFNAILSAFKSGATYA